MFEIASRKRMIQLKGYSFSSALLLGIAIVLGGGSSSAARIGDGRALLGEFPVALVSSTTNEPITQLLPNSFHIVDFDGDESTLNLVLNTDIDLGSVRFRLTDKSSGLTIPKTEGNAPFAFCGDQAGNFNPCGKEVIRKGVDYKLEVCPNGGEWTNYMFRVRATAVAAEPVPSASGKMARFQLINANTNEVIDRDLMDGTVLTAKEGDAWNIEVIPLDPAVGFVKFTNGHKEGRRPYSLCGDYLGTFDACEDLHKSGDHSFAVTLIAKGNVRLGRVYLNIRTVGTDLQPPPLTPMEGVAVGKWNILDRDAPITARHEACFVWVNGKAYLIGGRRQPATEIFDPVTNSWTARTKPPRVLHHMQCVVIENEIWMVSPWTGSYPREKTPDEMYIYDTRTDTWNEKPAMPEDRRRGSSAVVYDSQRKQIYVSHGNVGGHETYNHNSPKATGWLDIYDIQTGEWSIGPTAPNPRDHTGGALLRGGRYLCVAGGRDSGRLGWPAVRTTDCFDLETRIWSEEAPIPVPRAGSSYGTTCDGEYLLVAGGELGNSVFSQFSAFNGVNWVSLSNLRIARHGSGIAVDCTGGKMYIASGSGGPRGGPELTSVEVMGL